MQVTLHRRVVVHFVANHSAARLEHTTVIPQSQKVTLQGCTGGVNADRNFNGCLPAQGVERSAFLSDWTWSFAPTRPRITGQWKAKTSAECE